MQNYPITEAEGLQLLIKHCQPNDGCWLFRSRQYTFKKARRLHDYEKTANLPLPEILILQNTTINGIGIRVGNTFFEWNKIAVIGTIDQSEGGEDPIFLYAILFLGAD